MLAKRVNLRIEVSHVNFLVISKKLFQNRNNKIKKGTFIYLQSKCIWSKNCLVSFTLCKTVILGAFPFGDAILSACGISVDQKIGNDEEVHVEGFCAVPGASKSPLDIFNVHKSVCQSPHNACSTFNGIYTLALSSMFDKLFLVFKSQPIVVCDCFHIYTKTSTFCGDPLYHNQWKRCLE